MTNDEIRELATEHGFTVKRQSDGGTMDLNPYVYDFARALIEVEREACARACENFAHGRFAERGRRDMETGCAYYDGSDGELCALLDQEDYECAEAIRMRSNVVIGRTPDV